MFSTRSHKNRAVLPQKMARGLKFRIYIEEGFYYLCSENKGANQLRGYREADLRLCFRICKKPFFSRRGSYNMPYYVCQNEVMFICVHLYIRLAIQLCIHSFIFPCVDQLNHLYFIKKLKNLFNHVWFLISFQYYKRLVYFPHVLLNKDIKMSCFN